MTPRPGKLDDADTIRTELYVLREQLPVVVVYNHPQDFPDYFVARVWTSLPLAYTGTMIAFRKLETLRRYLAEVIGLTKLDRQPDDDPTILETWL
jgi:hypothetical protein